MKIGNSNVETRNKLENMNASNGGWQAADPAVPPYLGALQAG